VYALLINLMAIDQARVATRDNDARVIRPDVRGPGIPAGFTPSHLGGVFAAKKS
jgi:hypothetical protein